MPTEIELAKAASGGDYQFNQVHRDFALAFAPIADDSGGQR
jgi:hypothetical protein